jgi:hypothetical protein
MKKILLTLAGLVTLSASASDYKTYSFVNPQIVSFIVSNTVAVTNLNSIAAGGFVGASTAQTNGQGQLTNVLTGAYLQYTSSPPVLINGSTPALGTLVVITNNTPLNTGTNAQGVVTNGILITTNNTVNFLSHVPIESGMSVPDEQSKPGAAGNTNICGLITIRSYANFYGETGNGSNTVSVVFVPIMIDAKGVTYEPSDASHATPYAFTLTYTNNAGVLGTSSSDQYLPTVFQYQLPRYLVSGFNGLRCRSVSSGASPNGVWISDIKFTRWSP